MGVRSKFVNHHAHCSSGGVAGGALPAAAGAGPVGLLAAGGGVTQRAAVAEPARAPRAQPLLPAAATLADVSSLRLVHSHARTHSNHSTLVCLTNYLFD